LVSPEFRRRPPTSRTHPPTARRFVCLARRRHEEVHAGLLRALHLAGLRAVEVCEATTTTRRRRRRSEDRKTVDERPLLIGSKDRCDSSDDQ
jgi:hypothetical protein